MKRREVVKRVAATTAGVGLLGCNGTPLKASVAPFDWLQVYDPTLDIDAKPAFLDDSEIDGFEPLLLIGFDRMSSDYTMARDIMKAGAVVDSKIAAPFVELAEPNRGAPNPDFAHHFRVTLGGKVVKAAFEADRRAGWVRFQAGPTPDGKDVVTGIAFGSVAFHVRKGLISCQLLDGRKVVVDFPSMKRRPYPAPIDGDSETVMPPTNSL